MGIDILTLAAARAGKGGGSASKYKQPDWGAETAIVDILPGIMIEGEEQMPIMKQFTLIDGKEYIVNWNAKDYTCKAITLAGDVIMIGLGNVGLLMGGEDTGEPFVIMNLLPADAASMGMYGAAMAFDGSTSATLFIKGEGEVLYPIPTKYLENVMRVTCYATADNITSDKTFAEIEDAIANGVYVYAIASFGDDTFIYQLTSMTNTHIIFYQVETKTRLMVSNDNHWTTTDLS